MEALLIISISILYQAASASPPYPYKTDVVLNNFNRITVNWRSDDIQERVYFALECSVESDTVWLVFGFSDQGDYEGADLCLWNGRTLEDTHVDQHGSIRSDIRQNCHLDHIDRFPDGRISIFFWRPYDTCDKNDYTIENGTTQLVLILGKTKRRNVFGNKVLKSIKPTRLIETVRVPPLKMTSDVETIAVVAKNVTIPATETTYWCTVVKLPPMQEKRHIVKFEAIIEEGEEAYVHHMEVYHCERPAVTGRLRFPMYNGQCHLPTVPTLVKGCKRVIGAWAMGAPPLVYPDQAGAPIGGSGYFPFVMLEIHYNNPSRKRGVLDNSGMRFYVTSKLRPYDAGVMEVGLEYTDRMAIPPGQSSFTLTGHCTPECTDALLPNRPINIFASQLHSHLTGRRLSTSLVRERVQVAVINPDNHYSPHWQEIRPINSIQIQPGDSLITTCSYDTSTRKNITLGGYGITDEMCVNYIHYYPKSKLEVCKSAVDPSALKDFFQFMNQNEGQPTRPELATSINYKSIDWTRRRVAELKKLYDIAPVLAECRTNDGQRLNLKPRKPVSIGYPLPEKPRQCENDQLLELVK